MAMQDSLDGSKKSEWRAFLLVTFVFMPLLAVMAVGAYGFIVWSLQIIFGPPGHGG